MKFQLKNHTFYSEPTIDDRKKWLQKCCGSKILGILSLFFMKRYIIRMFIYRNVAFSGYFSVFRMRYSRIFKKLQKFLNKIGTISKISRELFKIHAFAPCLHLDGVGK